MKCLENPIWNDYTREELRKLKVDEPDEICRKKVQIGRASCRERV